MYLVTKYHQYKRQQLETQRRKSTEKELQCLSQKIEKLLARLDDNDSENGLVDDDACVVCLSAKPCMQTFPCGHKVVCRKCFVKTIQVVVSQRCLPLRCVVCRAKILKLKQAPETTLTPQPHRRTFNSNSNYYEGVGHFHRSPGSGKLIKRPSTAGNGQATRQQATHTHCRQQSPVSATRLMQPFLVYPSSVGSPKPIRRAFEDQQRLQTSRNAATREEPMANAARSHVNSINQNLVAQKGMGQGNANLNSLNNNSTSLNHNNAYLSNANHSNTNHNSPRHNGLKDNKSNHHNNANHSSSNHHDLNHNSLNHFHNDEISCNTGATTQISTKLASSSEDQKWIICEDHKRVRSDSIVDPPHSSPTTTNDSRYQHPKSAFSSRCTHRSPNIHSSPRPLSVTRVLKHGIA